LLGVGVVNVIDRLLAARQVEKFNSESGKVNEAETACDRSVTSETD